jgi:hypothetical protein
MITVTEALQDLAAIEKARKKKDREAAEPEALTPAHEAAQAEADAMMDSETTAKAISDIGCDPGPGTFAEPGMIGPEDSRRPYLGDGHSAASPQQGPPNTAPLPPQHPGILQPLQQSAVPAVAGSGPVVQGLAQHQARAARNMPTMP